MKMQPIENCIEALIDYRGKTPKKTESGVRLVTAKVIKAGRITDKSFEYIAEDDYDSWMRRGLPIKGDVLVTTEAPLGEVAQIESDEKIALAQRVILLRANPDVMDQDFLLFAMQSDIVQGGLNARATGTTVAGIKQSELRKVLIPCPELDQQMAVSGNLKAYDNLIENNNRRIAILEDMAQSLYREWFVKFRFPGHENVKFKDSPLGQIPEGWEVKRLDDFVVLQRGFDLPKKKRNEEGGIPIYAASGINGYHDEAKTKAPGLVTGRSGTLGVVKIVLEDFWPLNTSLWVKEFKNCSAYYAYYLLAGLDLERFNSGASVPTLNRNDVHGHQLISPPVELIAEFEFVAKDFFQQIEVLTKKNKILSAQRDMLLPKLISGNIDV